MSQHLHIKFTVPFKGVVEERAIKLFRSGAKKWDTESLQTELREVIGEPNLTIISLEVYPENHNFHADIVATYSDTRY